MTDPATAPPVNQVLPAWDFVTGAYCAFALLAGLCHRDASGEGSEIRVPLGDVAIGTMANSGAMAEMLYRGGDRERLLATAICAELCDTLIEGGVDRLHFYTLNRPEMTRDVCAALGVQPVRELEAVA